jgi:hypothetical protein
VEVDEVELPLGHEHVAHVQVVVPKAGVVNLSDEFGEGSQQRAGEFNGAQNGGVGDLPGEQVGRVAVAGLGHRLGNVDPATAHLLEDPVFMGGAVAQAPPDLLEESRILEPLDEEAFPAMNGTDAAVLDRLPLTRLPQPGLHVLLPIRDGKFHAHASRIVGDGRR